ncbi:MAG: hypothetical protein ABII82_19380 [Verrucomicrobiota bacterium]
MPPSDQILRLHHRRRRCTLLVWALVAALLAGLASGASLLGWWSQAHLAGLACAALAVVCLAVWFVRARRLTREALARRLDTEWQLSARLESSAEVAADSSAFARALRDDASRHLATRRLPAAPWWHGGLALLMLALIAGVVEISILGWRLLAAPAVEQPAELPEDITATIDWISPHSEIKATAIEEIPLAATATTATGFRSVTLEISINGAPALSRPLDLDALAQPGTHAIELPFYLDEIEANPFDIVAYHLRADRTTRAPTPVVTSPLQFIQIRPAREDVELWRPPPGDGPPPPPIFQLAQLVGALKAAQLALLKQNFLLAHAPLAKTDPVWIEENTRVATDQTTFADKVIEAREFAITEAFPPLVVDNLGQIEPIARDAAALIAKTDNEPATPLQGRSLGLITELEKLIQKIIIDSEGKSAGPPEPKNPDPFKDDQKFRLPPRKSTAAGELEQLAKKQAEQTKEEAKPADAGKSPDQKSEAEKQADLAAQLAKLAASQKLSPAAQKGAEQAAKDAAKAAEHLKHGDPAAARSPATAAAEELKNAVAAQEEAGRQAALAQLDAARRALNEAARIPDPAERAAALAEIARQLREDARAQQETGSAEAAKKLTAAAEAQKAAEAAARGEDQKPGTKPGDQPGTGQPGDQTPVQKPGDQATSADPGDQPGGPGEKPGDQAGTKPGSAPGLAPDPSGDLKLPDPAGSESGQAPGTQPGSSPGTGDTPGEGTGSGPGNHPGQTLTATPLENAAEAAAQAEIALAGYRVSLERALRQLAPGTTPGSGPGSGPGEGEGTGPSAKTVPTLTPREAGNIELAAQLAESLLPGAQAGTLRREIQKKLSEFSPSSNVVMPADLISAVDQLRLLLESALGSTRRDETVRRYNPDDIPPGYRDAVERYFEQLSREPAR